MATKTIFVGNERLSRVIDPMMDGHVTYAMISGKNRPSIFKSPGQMRRIDCSGFVRYVLYHACDLLVPDGSWAQNHYFASQHYEKVDYSEDAGSLGGILRLGYFAKPNGMHAGHIWFVLNGLTIESRGHKGPTRRPWDTKVLADHATHCYILGPTYNILIDPQLSAPGITYA